MISTSDAPDTMIVWDKKGNHKRGRNVVHADGHVEFMTEEVFQKRLAQQMKKFAAK